ncbi:hypothetical protein CYMTET_52029 [Cymbomonas tetramitiformis]|uniref:Uncharacterized protein n=1 Tax=Cymbomonas tetramitiformis TaxID=36881 RepID=A0AAE0BLM6_9CHLO|nr:hypothetical protein CYMTET_52029 [Cymbomonas tetramitiformis]
MDAVQRAYESQVRREHRKRQQLQKQYLLEEATQLKIREKEKKERAREHLLARQELERMELEEQHRLERAAKAAEITHNKEQMRRSVETKNMEKRHIAEQKEAQIHMTRMAANDLASMRAKQREDRVETVREFGSHVEEVRRADDTKKKASYEAQVRQTQKLREQAARIAKNRAGRTEDSRRKAYTRAREEEQIRVSRVQRNTQTKEQRTEQALEKKQHSVIMQQMQAEARAKEIRKKVQRSEYEEHAFRAEQATKLKAKQERAAQFENEKARLVKEMSMRRDNLSHDLDTMETAISSIRSTRTMRPPSGLNLQHSLSTLDRFKSPQYYEDDNFLRSHNSTMGFTPSAMNWNAQTPFKSTTKKRPKSATRASSYATPERTASPDVSRSISPQKHAFLPQDLPMSDGFIADDEGGPIGPTGSRSEQLARILADEQNREEERQSILLTVKDPRQRQRLYMLFNTERDQAKSAIEALQRTEHA